MTTHTSGLPVAHGACPACGGGLRYSLGTRRLTCRACPWAVTLTPDEHEDFTFAQIWPEAVDFPAFLAAIARRVALVPAPPEQVLVGTQDGGWKWRVCPRGPETPQARAGRLGEQAAINNVEVVPLTATFTQFRVSSQRRGPDGRPVCWYAVLVTAQTARCSCPAPNDTVCAHLAAVHTFLLDLQAGERAEVAWNSKSAAEVAAQGAAAARLLWG